MEINGKKYGFSIEPCFGKVMVEIYKVEKGFSDDKDWHIHLEDKEFGSFWRKPIPSDYQKARIWAEEQMECIRKSNQPITIHSQNT